MNISKEAVLYGIIGLLVGLLVTGYAAGYAVNNSHNSMMRMMGMDTARVRGPATNHSEMSMAEMTEQLKGLQGDEFDQAFIEMMIAHHEGAVDMAELIPTRALHAEVKTLGEAIITAQTKEIADMKQWQRDWDYASNEMMDMMHGGH
jgi:uncharacterized protein (DUF305 family)